VPGSVYSVIVCPSALRAGIGVIATAPSVNAAPNIDSATIRIVCLIIVLPGLSYSTMRKLPPARTGYGENLRTPKAPIQYRKPASILRGRRKLKR